MIVNLSSTNFLAFFFFFFLLSPQISSIFVIHFCEQISIFIIQERVPGTLTIEWAVSILVIILLRDKKDFLGTIIAKFNTMILTFATLDDAYQEPFDKRIRLYRRIKTSASSRIARGEALLLDR